MGTIRVWALRRAGDFKVGGDSRRDNGITGSVILGVFKVFYEKWLLRAVKAGSCVTLYCDQHYATGRWYTGGVPTQRKPAAVADLHCLTLARTAFSAPAVTKYSRYNARRCSLNEMKRPDRPRNTSQHFQCGWAVQYGKSSDCYVRLEWFNHKSIPLRIISIAIVPMMSAEILPTISI